MHMSAGYPSISSLILNRTAQTLTCISNGGPATNVRWTRSNQHVNIDGTIYQQSQTVIDTETATYETILTSNANANLVGSFMCQVSNARGSAYKSISTNGTFILMR